MGKYSSWKLNYGSDTGPPAPALMSALEFNVWNVIDALSVPPLAFATPADWEPDEST